MTEYFLTSIFNNLQDNFTIIIFHKSLNDSKRFNRLNLWIWQKHISTFCLHSVFFFSTPE